MIPHRWQRLAAIIMTLLLPACPSCESPEPRGEESDAGGRHAEHVDEPKHEELAKRVRLTPKVVEDAQIRVAPATRESLVEVVALPGELAADPDKLAEVASPIGGRLERIDFREGGVVKRGDVLAVVRVPDFARAKAEYAATAAKAEAARSNAQRLQALSSRGLAAEQEVLSANAEAGALQAQAAAASELLKAMDSGGDAISSRLSLRAPISGTVIRRSAVVGQPVSSEHSIATLAELSELWFLGRVFEKDLGRVRIGARTEVTLNAFPRELFEGAVEYVGKQVDPMARTVTARVRIANKEDQLSLGLFGTARVAVATQEASAPVLVVPQTAVVEIGDKRVVFVREPDLDFEMHEVVLGPSSIGKVEVVSGLREGELVVVAGAFTLKSVTLKGQFGEEE